MQLHWLATHRIAVSHPPCSGLPAKSTTKRSPGWNLLVDARRRVGVLLGESEVGKSLRCGGLSSSPWGCAVATIDTVGVGTRDLLNASCWRRWAPARGYLDMVHLWRLVGDRIAENRWQMSASSPSTTQAGGARCTDAARATGRLDATPDSRWTIVLAAELQQAARWNESLRELVDANRSGVLGKADDRLPADHARRGGPGRPRLRR